MSSSNNSKQNDGTKTPTATIKIAAKDLSQRNSGGSTADPGPGDPSAAPSEAPQLVDIPRPPTSSQLIVKSTQSRAIKTINEPMSSISKNTQTNSVKTAPTHSSGGASPASASGPPSTGDNEHDEVEEGEGEVEHPDSASPSPSTGTKGQSVSGASVAPTGQMSAGGKSASGPTDLMAADEQPSGGVDTAPASAGSDKMSSKTSGKPPKSQSVMSSDGRKSVKSSKSNAVKPSTSHQEHEHEQVGADGKKKKKVTKFRYHKRITVRTHGKTSPSTIMDKVNKKDHKAALTPSTIEDMDPQELMRRAGIKGNSKAHWRVRLRQTKRMTKDGKTTTQTKVAYRDSEGNKRVKTSSTPFCKHCGKKLEECRCDEPNH